MNNKVKPIPDGYHSVCPCLVINGAEKAIDFYKKIFNATEASSFKMPDGRIAHAELKIGDSKIMLSDEWPNMGITAPKADGNIGTSLYLYLENVDEIGERATKAGVKWVRPIENQFYGDRSGTFVDPFGHTWHIATHVEDVSDEEMHRRSKEAAKHCN